MNTSTNGNSPADAIAADQQLARLATVDLNDYAYWANNNGKGISIKVSFPVELKAVLGEHCLGRRTTLADFIRTADPSGAQGRTDGHLTGRGGEMVTTLFIVFCCVVWFFDSWGKNKDKANYLKLKDEREERAWQQEKAAMEALRVKRDAGDEQAAATLRWHGWN